jgi:uncharacterized cupin superfamily protein
MHALAHWDDIDAERDDVGPLQSTWTQLSLAVGLVRLGVNRIAVEPGCAGTPQHAEDEEVFYILGGSGFSVQEDGCFAIGAGDVVHYAAWNPAHTVVAGDDGLDLIAFGTADMSWLVRFPRILRVQTGGLLVAGEEINQWDIEGQLPRIDVKDPPDPRPASIVNIADVPSFEFERGPARSRARFVARTMGMRRIALNHAELLPGGEAAPPHCHSHEEELFVILDGDGVLLLGADEEEHPVRAGSIVGRPAGSGVAHAFRAGESGMTMLMFSDKHPGDTAYYPRSGKVTLRGLGITIKPEIVPWGD